MLYDMITSVIENEEGIRKVLIQIDLKNVDKILSNDEIKILKDICDMIKPFKTSTQHISGEYFFSTIPNYPVLFNLVLFLEFVFR